MNQTTQEKTIWSRRTLLRTGAALAGLGAGASIFGLEEIFAQAAAPAASTKSTLILLGTQGGPNVNLTRGETASVVMAGGQPYLVDCGYGTVRALVEAGIRIADVKNVFISHLHDDHTADLAALLTLKWTGGNTNPGAAAIYGPFGTKAMVAGAMTFFKANAEIRMVDEGRTIRPEKIYSGHDLAAPKIAEVFKDERVTVLAAENTHFPERAKEKMPYRSFAYRFNMPDRSIVLSGDTAYSTGLVELARGADVLVCESITMEMRQLLESTARGSANTESINRHILETHSTTEDAGRMASEARVKTLVLYHLLPGGNTQRAVSMADDAYISGVKKYFNGEVIVGKDQMKI